jgi:hypothetical protein
MRTKLLSKKLAASMILGSVFLSACTGQLKNSFRFAQQLETFSSQLQINTKIDLLWVVDNSASMDISQEKLRNCFAAFANKYMQPTWDIRVAVITTDTYLANPAFNAYLNTVIPGSVGWTSPYVLSKLATFVNPPSNPTLVNLSTGAFTNGVKFKDLAPVWGPDYAKLLPGNHDGPITGFCFDLLPYFLKGQSLCNIRDNPAMYNGPDHCITPGPGETGVTQCVNTTQNDTIHSGRPIINTQPPVGVPGDAAWKNQLIRDFVINITTGSVGSGSERGLSSVLQVISDNEAAGSLTKFFRKDSFRGIIFVSDEEDQSMDIPASPAPGFSPFSHYKCDQASLLSKNPAAKVTGPGGYCCTTPGNNCQYGSNGLSCGSKTVDGHTYTIGLCADSTRLIPVANVKSQLDTFFQALDQVSTDNKSYFVASIVPTTAASITAMQTGRNSDDITVGGISMDTIDRGDRYLALGSLVQNGSLAMDIGANDYSPIMDQIGLTIIQKKSVFQLARAPSGQEDMVVMVKHADGSVTVINNTQYTVSGSTLTITDLNFALSLKATDQLVVDYQPKSENG